MRVQHRFPLGALLVVAGCGGAATADPEVAVVAQAPRVACSDGGPSPAPKGGRDARIGPLTIMGARRTMRHPRDAFKGHGWKLPVIMAADATATLVVPRPLLGRVGLVYTRPTQRRVWRRGVRAADARLRFEACSGEDAPPRTGWPGGIVVDRTRCATLRVRIAGEAEPVERRVPLGKRCG